MNPSLNRRHFSAATAGISLSALLGGRVVAQTSSPEASPVAGAWSYTDVLGVTVELPERPVRIAANLVTAAALWDLGIQAVAVFDWTASAYPDGDHIAWGNVDPSAVSNIGDADGNILPEDLIATDADLVLTLTFDPGDASQTAGVIPDLAPAINEIAPVLVVTDMASTEIQLQRLVDFAALLGADLEAASTAEARTAYEAKIAEFQETAATKADVSSVFMNLDEGEIYVGGPQGVAELQFLQSLGLTFANADSDAAGDFWETLSAEEAMKYPADILYTDVYSSYKTAEELSEHPVFAVMPAVTAGQVGAWNRDFPVNYAGLTTFLEDILVTLRAAEKVTE